MYRQKIVFEYGNQVSINKKNPDLSLEIGIFLFSRTSLFC